MINSIESISTIARKELVGATCYVENYSGGLTECVITRIDLFISNRGIGVRAHLKGTQKGTINYPLCVTLEDYNHDIPYKPVGFLTSIKDTDND